MNKDTGNSMMIITQMENGKKSFGLVPISNDCNFLEARFSLEHKVLTVMTKVPMKEFKLLPKLDTNGNPKASKVNKEGISYERIIIDSFYSFQVTERKDIETLVNTLDSTVTTKDLEKYFVVEEKKKDESPTLSILNKDGE